MAGRRHLEARRPAEPHGCRVPSGRCLFLSELQFPPERAYDQMTSTFFPYLKITTKS